MATEAENAHERIEHDFRIGRICNVDAGYFHEIADRLAETNPSLPADSLYSGKHIPSGGMSFGPTDPVLRRIKNETR